MSARLIEAVMVLESPVILPGVSLPIDASKRYRRLRPREHAPLERDLFVGHHTGDGYRVSPILGKPAFIPTGLYMPTIDGRDFVLESLVIGGREHMNAPLQLDKFGRYIRAALDRVAQYDSIESTIKNISAERKAFQLIVEGHTLEPITNA